MSGCRVGLEDTARKGTDCLLLHSDFQDVPNFRNGFEGIYIISL